MKELIKLEDIKSLKERDAFKNEVFRLVQTGELKTYNIEEIK